MRKKKKHMKILFLACMGSMLLLGGCAKTKEPSVSEKAKEEALNSENETDAPEAESVGEFSMQDIEGETYTQEMFSDYDLTMVNVFTTWCTPCVNEIPDLEKLKNEMADQGVNVVGIVLDAADGTGSGKGKTSGRENGSQVSVFAAGSRILKWKASGNQRRSGNVFCR